MIRVLSVIFGLFVFYFFDHAFYIHFHFRHYIYAVIVLVFGMLLSPLYYYYESYDKILHLIMPIFGSIAIFYVVDKSKLAFKYKLLITLTSVVFFLTILEIGEYLFEVFWGLKLQGVYVRDITGLEKYKLVLGKNEDTMIDLIIGLTGTLIFVMGKSICYFFNKRYYRSKNLKLL